MASAKSTCTIGGCEKEHKARGYCESHYQRLRLYGSPTREPRQPRNLPQCTVDDCAKKPRTRNAEMCNMHYTRMWRHGDLEVHHQAPVQTPTYRTLHNRLAKDKGPASTYSCVDCGGQAAQWSYDHRDPDELSAGKMEYSLKHEHYQPRCVPCHHVFDIAWESANGRPRHKSWAI